MRSREPALVAPFGLRLSPDAVQREFRTVWNPRSVVLVEGSDLERADAYKVFATSEEWSRLRKQALAWTDAMVGRLLADVDSRRDAVVVGTSLSSWVSHKANSTVSD